MCPVESPVGAEATPAPDLAEGGVGTGFTRAAAARIVGLAPSELHRWERLLLKRAGFTIGPTLTLADLVALAALSVTERCLGAGAKEFAVGHARVFEALRARADVERLDGFTALVSRNSARIAERYDTDSCAAADILVIPLRPILADFRSQAFA
jgi:hypothetical protein